MILKLWIGLAAIVGWAATAWAQNDGDALEKNLERINLPPGFEISIYARVDGAREMAIGMPMGIVFVGSRSEVVHAVVDRDKDRKADFVVPMIEGLNAPSGIAYHGGYLYVSEQHRLSRVPAAEIGHDRNRTFRLVPLYEDLPDESWHGTRSTEIGPDGKVYIAIGVPCNICMPDGIEDAIIRLNQDGSGMEVFARGIRNSVGMDFHPRTGELFFTDNGVDNMGDDSPPGEFNHAPEAGLHFGFPYYGGGDHRHADWQDKTPPQEVTMPAVEFQAHVAALGLTFYRGDQFPESYHHDAFVAQHGSWNRSSPVGYRVVRILFDDQGRATGHEVFADGWLGENGEAWGRPTDVEELPDGSLLVSDDWNGVIYRISYTGG